MTKLKHAFLFSILFATTISILTSCKKQTTDLGAAGAMIHRKIQFSLYTNKDFSSDNNSIVFTLFVQNLQNKIIWDSVLMSMKVKDIPDPEHKLLIEKTISDDGRSILKVGFKYSIDNVGYSWFYDTCNAAVVFKEISFNFQ